MRRAVAREQQLPTKEKRQAWVPPHPPSHTYQPQHMAALYTSRYARVAVMAMVYKKRRRKEKRRPGTGPAATVATGNARSASAVRRAGSSRGRTARRMSGARLVNAVGGEKRRARVGERVPMIPQIGRAIGHPFGGLLCDQCWPRRCGPPDFARPLPTVQDDQVKAPHITERLLPPPPRRIR